MAEAVPSERRINLTRTARLEMACVAGSLLLAIILVLAALIGMIPELGAARRAFVGVGGAAVGGAAIWVLRTHPVSVRISHHAVRLKFVLARDHRITADEGCTVSSLMRHRSGEVVFELIAAGRRINVDESRFRCRPAEIHDALMALDDAQETGVAGV